MPIFVVEMRPPKGSPQTFEAPEPGGEGTIERPLLRSIELEAIDLDDAREIANAQAQDIARQDAIDSGLDPNTDAPKIRKAVRETAYVIASAKKLNPKG